MEKHALFFVNVWPEAVSSAAGVHTRALMRALQNGGWKLAAVSPSAPSPYSEALNALGIASVTCDPNKSEPTETALRDLPAPALVIFDRFLMEEQFGWRARELWPSALFLVDTVDLHSVRRAREKLAKEGASWDRLLRPSVNDLGEDLLRELSSLYRSDAALVVSSREKELLGELGFPAGSVLHLPFPGVADPEPAPFSARRGFATLGNFRHGPNADSVNWLVRDLWPLVRQNMPLAELHLYGSYPTADFSRHKGKDGIYSHGPVADHRAALRRHRVLLAPLRFGAGIKGKVLEAWGTGTPVLGSPLTFEGMGTQGLVATDAAGFVSAATALHEDQILWDSQSRLGLESVARDYDREKLAVSFLAFVSERMAGMAQARARNLTGAMLRHHQSNSTKYFSRWIEAKNANGPKCSGGA